MNYKRPKTYILLILNIVCVFTILPMKALAQSDVEIPYTSDEEFANLLLEIHTIPSYAGSWVEHTPRHQLFVGFASPDYEEILEPYLARLQYADEIIAVQQNYSWAELREVNSMLSEFFFSKISTDEDFPAYGKGIRTSENKVRIRTDEPDVLQAIVESEESLVPYLDAIMIVYHPHPQGHALIGEIQCYLPIIFAD